MIKIELTIGGNRYNVTKDLRNWSDIETSVTRNSYSGLIRSFANEFEFVGDAYILLENEYLTNYLNFKAIVIISIQTNDFTWIEKYRNDLDPLSYKSNGSVIIIKAIDNDLATIVRSNKSQNYDIPVSELHGVLGGYLVYDRIELKNSIIWYINGHQEEGSNEQMIYVPSGYWSLPVAYDISNVVVKGYIEPTDVNNDGPILTVLQNNKFRLKVNFDIKINYSLILGGGITLIVRKKNGETLTDIISLSIPHTPGVVTNINIDQELLLQKDDLLYLGFQTPSNPGSGAYFDAILTNISNITLEYVARNSPVNITIFSPKQLLTRLLYYMTGKEVTCELTLPTTSYTLMAAAESIRNIPNAKVHTSFSKFTQWLEAVFGYTYTIENDKLIFKHREKFFDSFQEQELLYVKDLSIDIESKIVYSGIKVGYEKNDYDEINGRDEFHTTSEFTTGVNGIDNVAEFISPYRADCYGFEFLSNKRDEETKDNESDNDLFFIDVRQNTYPGAPANSYVLNRFYTIEGVLSPSTIFNAAYSPRNMLLANKRYIGACTNSLKFTASDGNADVSISGVSEKTEVKIDNRLFRVENISISTTGLSPFPGNYTGLICFNYDNLRLKGFIQDITENMGTHEATTYKLICQSIEKN